MSSSRFAAALASVRTLPIIVLLAALVVGTTLRVIGLGWGLPAMLHPDEWAIVDGAIGMARRNSFEPEFYMRPDHLEIKLSYLAYAVAARMGFGLSIEDAYAVDPGLFLYISRLITALFGVAQIVLAYLIGRRIAPTVGAVAAVLFALSPLLVKNSHYATPDVPLTTMLLGVTLACMAYLARPRLVSLLAASACVSAAIAIKYPGAIAASVIALVVIWTAIRDRRPARIVTHGALAVVAVIGFLFAISPSLFTNFAAVSAAFTQEARSTHPGADGLGFTGNLAFYTDVFVSSTGIIVSLLAVLGVFFAIRHRIVALLPASIGLVFWISLSALPLHWDRWALPMFIAPLLAASVGAVYTARAVRALPSGRWQVPTISAVAALTVLSLGLGSAAATARFVAPDTRLAALPELASRGITTSNSSWEGYSPFQPGSGRNLFTDFVVEDGALRPVDPDTRFVILSGCMNGRYLREDKYKAEQEFYERLKSEATLIEDFPLIRGGSSVFEPLSVFHDIRFLMDVAAGGMTGCPIEVYELDSSG